MFIDTNVVKTIKTWMREMHTNFQSGNLWADWGDQKEAQKSRQLYL